MIPTFLLQRFSILLAGAGIVLGTAVAEASTPAARDLFEIHVRPTLIQHCIQCHGETEQEGGLQLTSLDALLKGGDSGPAIVPGNADESLILEALRFESFEMPPAGQLKDPVVEGFANWISAGAPWPEGLILEPTPVITEDDREWWCYQPIADPVVPDIDHNGWCRNEIDRFVVHR
ncbi:c-type cytochrome domain-containing protein, partial [Rhodopirellula bahusiensis]